MIPVLGSQPGGDNTHKHARPAVTFPAVDHHRHLASILLGDRGAQVQISCTRCAAVPGGSRTVISPLQDSTTAPHSGKYAHVCTQSTTLCECSHVGLRGYVGLFVIYVVPSRIVFNSNINSQCYHAIRLRYCLILLSVGLSVSPYVLCLSADSSKTKSCGKS